MVRYILVAIDDQSGVVLSCEGDPNMIPLVQSMGHAAMETRGDQIEASLTLAVQETYKSMRIEAVRQRFPW